MTRTLVAIVSVSLVIYALMCVITYFRQRQLLYFPTPASSVADVSPLWVDADDARLKVWTLNPGRADAVVYFGGNAEDVLYTREFFEKNLPAHTVYLLNYRGYGGSTGKPSERGFDADGLKVFDAISPEHARVSIIGRSIGSAVATHVAARRPVARMALVTPMDSIEAVARHHYPWLPVSLLLKDRYRSHEDAAEVTADTLVVIAEEDRIVPWESSKRLVDALKNAGVKVRVLEGAGHNAVDYSPEYGAAMSAFFSSTP
jgi:pimeloyl-ACP methyl ester carboxylesterase